VVETGAIEEVVDYLEGRTGPGDIVLVKGSNALRMNRLVPMLIGEGAQIS
jgi:UDP-N-acetylmuramyl pentapeptide synthase